MRVSEIADLMRSPLITLTTDFGAADPYVGVMKGVILGISPAASLVDISHDIQPQSILEGAFIIGGSHKYFPEGTVHVVVVDPGVGTSRKALLLSTPHAYFVAPDNGVLSHVLAQGFPEDPDVIGGNQVLLPPDYKAYRLNNEEFWLHPVSSTFHGRDIFAPVVAHLTKGVPVHDLGEETDRVAWLATQGPYWEGTILHGRVVHVDRFGNLITNIAKGLLPSVSLPTIEVKGHRVVGLSSSYEEGGPILAVIGSYDTLEVAARNGNASQVLQAQIGDPITVETGH